jgi:hypothetical protein
VAGSSFCIKEFRHLFSNSTNGMDASYQAMEMGLALRGMKSFMISSEKKKKNKTKSKTNQTNKH